MPEHGGHDQLLALARRSIEQGFASRVPSEPPELAGLPPTLATRGASFVTLYAVGLLRGCRGALEASRPIAHDVWFNAWASAFDDPRFPPLARDELTSLRLEISLLSVLEPIDASTESALVESLEPRRHGLVLAFGSHRATFLPQVWKSLDDAGRFIGELKAKAGLPGDFWSAEMRAWRYTVQSIREAD